MPDKWLMSCPYLPLPSDAVVAGRDCDGSTMYVCRFYSNGDLLPGKAIPRRKCAYVCYHGKEIKETHYELLLGDHYKWVPAVNCMAKGAVKGGETSYGETLYIGRIYYKGSLTCGKIHRSHNCLYIPFGCREVKIEQGYEMLVDKRKYRSKDSD